MIQANQLLLEGPDDIGVIYHLLDHYHISVAERGKPGELGKTTLVNGEGVERILQSLPVRLKSQDEDTPVKRLGIIIDTDLDLAKRWQSIKDILRRVGYTNVPENPAPAGTVIAEEDRIVIGIWLMPDNQLAGELEHFVRFLIKADDKLWNHAVDSVEQIPDPDRLFTYSDTIKAHMHTWLAWQKEPGKPMGQAIKKKFLDANTPHALHLVDWIRRLFPVE